MAHKDYVARGRAPAKKNTKKQPDRAPIPWLRLIITLTLVGAFGYFLWSIKDSAEEAPASSDIVVSETQEEDALPELPKEEWEFIKTLPGYEVEVDVPEHQQSDKRYLMQCGSFRSDEQASEMRARIAMQGLESQIRPSEGDNGRWYRVILGPYESKRDAERDKHALRRISITTCQIWYWNL
ncbi:SPOR domain-containing protein [Aestuariibacter salexigens]|uniref:SPOR domain-containing protein n=1 Tax=Aestuariibacter salexigens TaxID=226010 RepID=UPI00040471E1|nr:SPOR domain-containing protein [Aestuariibacter salexigens]